MKKTYPWTSSFAAVLPLLSLLITQPAIAEIARSSEAEQLISAVTPSGSAAAALLSEALLGHWESEDGSTHYYFGRDQVVVIYRLQGSDRSVVEHKQKLDYEVLAFNEINNWIEIEIETPMGWAQTRQFYLTNDRQSFIETLDVMGHAFSSEWRYVSSSQQP